MFLKKTILFGILPACAVLGFFALHAETFYGPTKLKEKTYEDLILNGPGNLTQIKAETLTSHGPLMFEEITVTDNAIIHGPAKGNKAAINDLVVHGPFKVEGFRADSIEVYGPTSLTQFKISDDAIIMGPLLAKDGEFDSLTTRGKMTTLEDVKAKEITIKKGKPNPVLTLKGKTNIKGNITFEGGDGKVVKEGDQVTIGGKIEGAAE